MEAHSHASEAGRALALRKYTPEVRLRTAVDTIDELRDGLDDAQRARLEAALQDGGDAG